MLKCLEALSEGASDVTFITHLSNNNTTIVIATLAGARNVGHMFRVRNLVNLGIW